MHGCWDLHLYHWTKALVWCLVHNTLGQCSKHLVRCLLPQLPAPFDIEALSAAYPTTYQDSMNTVLVQEAIRYNALLDVLDSSLHATLKALEGTVVMSPDLEKVANSLYDNQVCRLSVSCLSVLHSMPWASPTYATAM